MSGRDRNAGAPRPQALILDMDGLLLDTEPMYKRAWQQTARAFGYAVDDALYFRMVGRNNDDAERIMREAYGARFPMDAFRKEWEATWLYEVRTDGIPTKPGVDVLLEFVTDQSLTVAVATSSTRRLTDISLEAAGLAGVFSTIVTGDQIARGKPAPDIYLEAARRLSVPAARCVVLEDSDAGVAAAAAAGMTVVQIPDMKAPSEASRQRAFTVVENLLAATSALAGWMR